MVETLTDKRCRSKARALERSLADLYERKIKGLPSPELMTAIDEIDKKLGGELAKRPITNMEIDAACRRAADAFSSALRDEQARAAAAQGRSGAR